MLYGKSLDDSDVDDDLSLRKDTVEPTAPSEPIRGARHDDFSHSACTDDPVDDVDLSLRKCAVELAEPSESTDSKNQEWLAVKRKKDRKARRGSQSVREPPGRLAVSQMSGAVSAAGGDAPGCDDVMMW